MNTDCAVKRCMQAFPILLLTAIFAVIPAPQVQAQQAVVAVAERVTEKKVGTGAWTRAAKGAPLDANNRFRTGKRSKADLKFRDGSLLRLGQLSLIELRGAKNVQLLGGQLLFSMLKGGRVLAGSAAAAIKGSVGIIEVKDDGTAIFTLYAGEMDVEVLDEVVPVPSGTQVIVSPDGTISQPRRVAILLYSGGTLRPELVDEPVDAPFAGSREHETSMFEPSRIALDTAIDLNQISQFSPLAQVGQDVYAPPPARQNAAPIINFYNPFGAPPPELNTPAGTFGGTFGNGDYTITDVNGAPVDFPALPFTNFPNDENFVGNFIGNYVVAAPGQNAGQTVTFTQENGAISTLVTFADPITNTAGFSYVDPAGQRVVGNYNPTAGPFVRFVPLLQNAITARSISSLNMPLGQSGGVSITSSGGPILFLQRGFGSSSNTNRTRIAQLDTPSAPNSPSADEALAGAEDFLGEPPYDLDLNAAYRHIKEVSTNNGRSLKGDWTISGAYTDGGAHIIGAYLHGAVSQGRFLLDGTLRPLRVESNGRSTDLSTVSDLSLTMRDWRGEVQVGRQRFLRGPAQITMFGSLVRQGGREVMDAVRFAPDLGPQRKLELAYIYDAFPRALPYRISGSQGGLYGRFSMQERAGNFGLNVLRYSGTPSSSTLGYSLDFAVPLKRDEIELYGEVGRDMFRRRLSTVGLAFPGLYNRSDYDLYLEYSDMGNGTVAAPPNELAARVYHHFNKNLSGVLAVSHFSGFDTKVTLGLAFGQNNSGSYGRMPDMDSVD